MVTLTDPQDAQHLLPISRQGDQPGHLTKGREPIGFIRSFACRVLDQTVGWQQRREFSKRETLGHSRQSVSAGSPFNESLFILTG